MTARQYQVPPQLEAMLLEFTVNVLISQPADLAAFAVHYFSRLRRSSTGSVGAFHQLSPGDRIPSRRGSAASDHSSVFSEDEGEDREDFSEDEGEDREDFSEDEGEDREEFSEDEGEDREEFSEDEGEEKEEFSEELTVQYLYL